MRLFGSPDSPTIPPGPLPRFTLLNPIEIFQQAESLYQESLASFEKPDPASHTFFK